MVHDKWILCDNCGKKIRRITENTILIDDLVYCNRCHFEKTITVIRGIEMNLIPSKNKV